MDPYGVSLIVIIVTSHLVNPLMFGFELVNTDLQKYGVALFAALTKTVVLCVSNDVPDTVLVRVIVGSV